MPSKKKQRGGKARRAAKARTELKNFDAGTKNDVKSVELRMQRLQMNNNGQDDEDALLEEAINLAAAEKKKLDAAAKRDEENNAETCDHGFAPLPRGHVCKAFIDTYVREFTASKENSNVNRYKDAHEATKKWPEVWYNTDMLQLVVSYFLAEGTDMLLKGEDDLAHHSAVYASMFEQTLNLFKHWSGVKTCKSQKFRRWDKIGAVSGDTCDEHTLVSFFKKRIPCKCLDKRYKEVKSIAKMGLCDNRSCPLPDNKIERSKLMNCEQCLVAQYCSIECQKADWPLHKEDCVAISAIAQRELGSTK